MAVSRFQSPPVTSGTGGTEVEPLKATWIFAMRTLVRRVESMFSRRTTVATALLLATLLSFSPARAAETQLLDDCAVPATRMIDATEGIATDDERSRPSWSCVPVLLLEQHDRETYRWLVDRHGTPEMKDQGRRSVASFADLDGRSNRISVNGERIGRNVVFIIECMLDAKHYGFRQEALDLEVLGGSELLDEQELLDGLFFVLGIRTFEFGCEFTRRSVHTTKLEFSARKHREQLNTALGSSPTKLQQQLPFLIRS